MTLSNRTQPLTGVTERDLKQVEHALQLSRACIQLGPSEFTARETLNEINTALQSLEISEHPQLPAPAAA